jgi:hypothetical protein
VQVKHGRKYMLNLLLALADCKAIYPNCPRLHKKNEVCKSVRFASITLILSQVLTTALPATPCFAFDTLDAAFACAGAVSTFAALMQQIASSERMQSCINISKKVRPSFSNFKNRMDLLSNSLSLRAWGRRSCCEQQGCLTLVLRIQEGRNN